MVDFFNRINLIYGTVSEYCNETTCPTMSGGPRYEYLWADGDAFKKPTPLPAPKYIEMLMDWTEGQINNENVFPVSTDVPFPKSFIALCRKILTRLFRVFVHVYIHHFDRIVSIGAVSCLWLHNFDASSANLQYFTVVINLLSFSPVGSSCEHMLQTFLLLRTRIWVDIAEGARTIIRNDTTYMQGLER